MSIEVTHPANETVGESGVWRLRSSTFVSILTLAPTVLALGVFVYAFIAWTGLISLTNSRFVPQYNFVGIEQYVKLWSTPRWQMAVSNVWVFSAGIIGLSIVIGLLLAIFLDQKIRAENVLRTIYLYPMAISFIVTGIAWKWLLNPGLGIERLVRSWGFESFRFDWLVNPKMAVYTLVIAGVWQSSGFVMAVFLAGLRGIDGEIVKAAKIDGASMPRIYWSIIIPMLRPVFLSVVVVQLYQALRSYDLVVALTNGGPGFASDLPTTFMYNYTFNRFELAKGAASAMMILMTVTAVIVPYLYSELRHDQRNDH